MFTATEIEYLKSLAGTMSERGYTHYVARTISDSDGNDDFEVLFSKTEIVADSMYRFTVTDGLCYTVDSSTYNDRWNDARVSVSDFHGVYNIPEYEFCYTNADFGTMTAIHPDLMRQGGEVAFYGKACFFLLVLSLLVGIAFRLFGSRR